MMPSDNQPLPVTSGAPTTISLENLPREFTQAMPKARAAVLWERLWPRVVPPASITGLFLSASFAGVWGMATPAGRMAGVAAFAVALLGSVARPPKPFRTKTLFVTPEDAAARLDEKSGHKIPLAASLNDKPALDTPADRVKWNAHLSSLWQNHAAPFKVGMPHPGVQKADPFGLRFWIMGTLILTAAVSHLSQQSHVEQVKQAFDWSTPLPPATAAEAAQQQADILRVKAWVQPPVGISFKSLEMTEETKDDTQGGEKLEATQGSTLTIMIYGKAPRIEINGNVLPWQKEIPQGQDKKAYQYEVKLAVGDSKITIEGGPQWQIKTLADLPPKVSIEAIRPSTRSDQKSFDIDYNARDDHGYAGEIVIETGEKPDPAAKPLPSAQMPIITIN